MIGFERKDEPLWIRMLQQTRPCKATGQTMFPFLNWKCGICTVDIATDIMMNGWTGSLHQNPTRFAGISFFLFYSKLRQISNWKKWLPLERFSLNAFLLLLPGNYVDCTFYWCETARIGNTAEAGEMETQWLVWMILKSTWNMLLFVSISVWGHKGTKKKEKEWNKEGARPFCNWQQCHLIRPFVFPSSCIWDDAPLWDGCPSGQFDDQIIYWAWPGLASPACCPAHKCTNGIAGKRLLNGDSKHKATLQQQNSVENQLGSAFSMFVIQHFFSLSLSRPPLRERKREQERSRTTCVRESRNLSSFDPVRLKSNLWTNTTHFCTPLLQQDQ